MSEETTQVSEAVAVAAGMTADDLISQWTEQVDVDKEKDDEAGEIEVEASEEVAEEAKTDEVPAGEGGRDDEGADADPSTETVSDGSPAAKESPAENKTEPGVVDDKPVSVVTPPPELAELDKLIEETDLFDPDQSKKLFKTLAGVVKSQQDVIEKSRSVAQAAEVENYWKSYAAKNPEIGDTARKMWDESIKKHTERGLSGRELQAAATAEWEVRVELAKTTARSAKPEAPKSPQPKVTPGATRVTPQPTRTKPPYTPKRAEDKLSAGMYGDLTTIIDS